MKGEKYRIMDKVEDKELTRERRREKTIMTRKKRLESGRVDNRTVNRRHNARQMKQVGSALRPRSLEDMLLFCRGGWVETSLREARIKSALATDYTRLDISLGTELLTRP
jgi:hypothetical protein